MLSVDSKLGVYLWDAAVVIDGESELGSVVNTSSCLGSTVTSMMHSSSLRSEISTEHFESIFKSTSATITLAPPITHCSIREIK